MSHSNVSEADPKNALSLHDVTLHVLACGDLFDLDRRRPAPLAP
ncbi:hypothetical protein [Phenylobacterium sp.]